MGISYQKKRQTPKRGAGSSNLPEDANVFRCKPFCWFAAVFVFPGTSAKAGPDLLCAVRQPM